MSVVKSTIPKIRIYSISFDSSESNSLAFQQYIKDNRDIEGYWNYIPSVYFIKTNLPLSELSVRFKPFMPDEYIIAEIVGVKRMQGQLPHEAWKWFKMEELPTPTADKS